MAAAAVVIPQEEWTDIEPGATGESVRPDPDLSTGWSDIAAIGPAINPRHYDNPELAIKAAELAALYNDNTALTESLSQLRARVLEGQRLKSYLQQPSSSSQELRGLIRHCMEMQRSEVSWPTWSARVAPLVGLNAPKFLSDPRLHRRRPVVAQQVTGVRGELLSLALNGEKIDLKKEEDSGFGIGSLKMPIKLEMPQWFSR